jgi:hypothetical protein
MTAPVMVKKLTSAMFSTTLGLAAFVVVGGLELETLPVLSLFVMVPVTAGVVAARFRRVAQVREPWSPRVLELNSRTWREGPADVELLWRQRAQLRFRRWRPGPDVTIH